MKHAKHPEQFTVEAWSANAIAFIEEQGLTREFSDWCGGWPCPVSPQMVAAAPVLLESLEEALAALDGRTDGLDSTICCSGHECGCRGASNRDLLCHDIRQAIAKARGGDLEDRIAAAQRFAAQDSAHRTAIAKARGEA